MVVVSDRETIPSTERYWIGLSTGKSGVSINIATCISDLPDAFQQAKTSPSALYHSFLAFVFWISVYH